MGKVLIFFCQRSFSIPRFKHTGDIKGFAFVEFESAKVAQEAVEVLVFFSPIIEHDLFHSVAFSRAFW